MKEYETFGQALTRLMQEKDCTVKDLTGWMGLKSSNTIARLLADKSSPQKIKTFCDELLAANPLQLVEHEKQCLREAVSVSTMGAGSYRASKRMLYFVQEQPQSPSCVCKQAFGEGCLFISTLDDLMESYVEFESVSIMLQNCALGGVTRAIKSLLEQRIDKVTIEQYVNASEDQTREISDFINLLEIMGHPNYSFFFSAHRYAGGHDFYNVYSNVMVVLKSDRAGNKFTDIITLHSEESFTVLFNLPGEDSYQFHHCQFQALRLQHNPVKASHSSIFDLSGMCDYCQRLLEMDQNNPLLSIRPDISLCMVPPDIVQDTLEQLCRQHDYIDRNLLDRYMQSARARYQLFLHPPEEQCYLFSKAGLYRFRTDGKSRANVFGLRPLTEEERIRVLRQILAVAKTSTNTTFHLLKNELRYNNTAYLLYGSSAMLIDNYAGFRNYDAAQSYHSCWVHTPHITKSFSCFAAEDLLPNYTHTLEETVDFLEHLI